ncbi:Hsp20/alpha crystallin family protein [Methylosarcina fibrata]|uniref:Hsp20/alpha crystallin family protein n=1 Tax=Methylosarcina fibrata TaxID=105972 RepID=UPI00037D90DA|nr:Hsp20/alpha crystallin family protein [Methylosarcina fibrata]
MYRSMFPSDVFAEMDRLQRAMQQAFELSPNIRGVGRGGFPALNVGGTPNSVEVYAFAPGLDPQSIQIQLEKSTLSIAGERKSDEPAADQKTAIHIDERFAGPFRRVISLPDDIDNEAVSATYRDGVLHVSVKRRQAAAPRRITIE